VVAEGRSFSRIEANQGGMVAIRKIGAAAVSRNSERVTGDRIARPCWFRRDAA
jgi:hypothetical protein